MILKEKIEAQLPEWRERVSKLVKEKGDVKVGDVTIAQVYGGMRGVKALVTDISYVDPNEGIHLRGHTIPELLEKLPKFDGAEMPLVAGLYYLLLVGEIPTMEQAKEVEKEWKSRWDIPAYVLDVLRAMPADTHPMTFSHKRFYRCSANPSLPGVIMKVCVKKSIGSRCWKIA